MINLEIKIGRLKETKGSMLILKAFFFLLSIIRHRDTEVPIVHNDDIEVQGNQMIIGE
jgi:hypothetical protein